MCESLVAEELSLLNAEGDHLLDYITVVVLAAIAASTAVGVEDGLAEVVPLRGLEERHDGGVVEGEDPFAFHAELLGLVGGGRDEIVRQPREVGHGIDDEFVAIVILGEEIGAE